MDATNQKDNSTRHNNIRTTYRNVLQNEMQHTSTSGVKRPRDFQSSLSAKLAALEPPPVSVETLWRRYMDSKTSVERVENLRAYREASGQ